MKDKLYIVIPAYNEQENIRQLVDDWYPVLEKTGDESRLVIVNDGSRDDTFKILTELKDERPQLLPINKENSGHGPTIQYAYNYAISEGADYIFQTDSDGQTLASEFGSFWEDREKYDFIIGHRDSREDGFSRIVVTRVLRLVVFLFFHTWVKDANTPFRLMKADKLKELMVYVPENYFLTNVVISTAAVKFKYNVDFRHITFRPRQGGKNSINLLRIFKIGRKAVSDFIKINKTMKRQVN